MVNSDGDKGEARCSKCYFGLIKHFTSKLLSCKVKCLIYRTLIRPVLTYGSENWAMGKQGENLLRSLKRKGLRTILGLVLENGCGRKHKNSEIYNFMMNMMLLNLLSLVDLYELDI